MNERLAAGIARAIVLGAGVPAVLLAVGALGISAYSGGRILWRSIDGTVVAGDRVSELGCSLRVNASSGTQVLVLGSDACDRFRVGERIEKAAWSLETRSASGAVHRSAAAPVVFSVVALFLLGSVGIVAVLGLFIHLPAMPPRTHSAGSTLHSR
jgi:hypothetical protein